MPSRKYAVSAKIGATATTDSSMTCDLLDNNVTVDTTATEFAAPC